MSQHEYLDRVGAFTQRRHNDQLQRPTEDHVPERQDHERQPAVSCRPAVVRPPRSMSRLRAAWVVHAPSGLAVTVLVEYSAAPVTSALVSQYDQLERFALPILNTLKSGTPSST